MAYETAVLLPVVILVRVHEDVEEQPALLCFLLRPLALRPLALDLFDALGFFEFGERLVAAPVERVPVAVVRRVLKPLRVLEHLRVLLLEPDPLDLLLEEAEKTARAGAAPVGVLRQAQTAFLQDADDVPADQARF